MSTKAMNGTGPGAGVKDAIVKRDSDIAKDKYTAVERKLKGVIYEETQT